MSVSPVNGQGRDGKSLHKHKQRSYSNVLYGIESGSCSLEYFSDDETMNGKYSSEQDR